MVNAVLAHVEHVNREAGYVLPYHVSLRQTGKCGPAGAILAV